MKFVDLFAGLGGFHLALRDLGHDPVFACEQDEELRQLYQKNFSLHPKGDIRELDLRKIPKHDVLCAGFPCQPFSKAGGQEGLDCPDNGNLFDYIIQILELKKPRYFILENVPNLRKHNNGKTWQYVMSALVRQGYYVDAMKLSPHWYGIPQIRERLFIVGSLTDIEGFSWPARESKTTTSVDAILDQNPPEARRLSSKEQTCIAIWQSFLDKYPRTRSLPSFPIWAPEFGATYPFEEVTPSQLSVRDLSRFRGSFGTLLTVGDKDIQLSRLPSYARSRLEYFPDWKVKFIRQNRQLYDENRQWLEPWKTKLESLPASFQKLEWNCKGEPRRLSRYVLQFRASGLRVKRRTTTPTLVAMTISQVPIITWENRYLTVKEATRLQGMERLQYLPASTTRAFQALGNAVNVEIVRRIAKALLTSPQKVAQRSLRIESA